jgi:hypothetical protein
MHSFAAVLAAVALFTATAEAQRYQPSPNPVTDHVRRILPETAKKMIAAAELMPADKYTFRPTPPQMSFAQLIAHIVQTNAAICAGAGALPLPDYVKIPDTSAKDDLVAAIRKSFELCTDAFTKTMDADLGGEMTMMGRATGMSRGAALVTITNDWADHYSTQAAYLRLNGILPPTAQPAPPR